MDVHSLEWGKDLKRKYIKGNKPYTVLDVGSLDVNGSFREVLFDAEKYIGIDMQEGVGVDFTLNGHDLTTKFLDYTFDVVVCMNMMEHDSHFWITLEQINKVIKQGGLFFLGMPTFKFPLHEYPDDYYRFGESAFRQVLLEGYEVLDLKQIFTKPNINPVINALGRKL